MTNRKPLAGRVVLVTGAAHGMGRSHVSEFLDRGAIVGAVDVDGEALDRSLAGSGSRVTSFVADVSDAQQLTAAINTFGEQHGRIDVVISNAGTIHADTGIADTDLRDWDRTFKVHVHGALFLTQAALPWVRQSDSGRMIFISSMWAQRGDGFGYAYVAAKGALLSFSRNLAVELGPEGICVNALAVGCVTTRMADGYSESELLEESKKIPLGRWGAPEEISHVLSFLASTESSFVTGQTIAVNGGQIIAGS